MDGTPSGRQRHTACLVSSKRLFILGGFDGYRWLRDLHVLDVSQMEASAITQTSVGRLLGDLRGMVNNPDSFPDVTFLVEGKRVYAHRGMLAGRSEHFRAMFASGMRESSGEDIVMPDWKYTPFVAMVEFLYTGSVRVLEPQVAVDLMALADHNGLEALKELCQSSLSHSVDDSTVTQLLCSAHHCGAYELKRHCMRYLMAHRHVLDDPAAATLLQSEPELLMEITKASFSVSSTGGGQ
jgi:hypothetical protein